MPPRPGMRWGHWCCAPAPRPRAGAGAHGCVLDRVSGAGFTASRRVHSLAVFLVRAQRIPAIVEETGPGMCACICSRKTHPPRWKVNDHGHACEQACTCVNSGRNRIVQEVRGYHSNYPQRFLRWCRSCLRRHEHGRHRRRRLLVVHRHRQRPSAGPDHLERHTPRRPPLHRRRRSDQQLRGLREGADLTNPLPNSPDRGAADHVGGQRPRRLVSLFCRFWPSHDVLDMLAKGAPRGARTG